MTQSDPSTAEAAQAPPAAALPDYLTSPNAVFADEGVQWRYGKAPDYSKTRKVWEEGKKSNHVAGSLEQLVENLVKNWEVEASFKPRLEDWRTIDHDKYTFAMNGGPPQTAEHMLKVGTYNAIIEPNEYYDPKHSDFASSHKTFKRMMPTFAWEVVEVYSQPPVVAFKWRHWGTMKNDYVGFNNQGEKVTAKAHGGPIEIFGITVAKVDDKVRLQGIDTWMDPLAMFRQIAPHGIVNKHAMNTKVDKSDALDIEPGNDGIKIAEAFNHSNGAGVSPNGTQSDVPKHISERTGFPADAAVQQMGGCPFMSQSDTRSTVLPEDHPPVVRQNGDSAQAPAQPLDDSSTQMDIDTAAPAIPTPANDEKPEKIPTTNGAEQPTKPQAPAQSPLTHSAEEVHVPHSIYSSAMTGNVEDVLKTPRSAAYVDESVATRTYDAVDQHLEQSAEDVHPHPKSMEDAVKPDAGEAVAAPASSKETAETVKEMSEIKASETDLIMNRE